MWNISLLAASNIMLITGLVSISSWHSKILLYNKLPSNLIRVSEQPRKRVSNKYPCYSVLCSRSWANSTLHPNSPMWMFTKKNFPPNPLQAHDDSLLKSNFSKKLLLNQLKDDVLCLSKHDNQQSIFYAIITWHVNAILGSYTC